MFRPFLRKFVLVFFDDILVYCPNWQTHMSHLTTVLTVLCNNCFVANRQKCNFGLTSIDYLGHVISSHGIQMDPSKVHAVLKWPIPQTTKPVRGFLGLTGYYRWFICDYGKIAQPLTILTKKEGFFWGDHSV